MPLDHNCWMVSYTASGVAGPGRGDTDPFSGQLPVDDIHRGALDPRAPDIHTELNLHDAFRPPGGR